MPIPIIDSHIHLFPETHLSTLAWYGPHNPLGAQHSLDEYRTAIQSVPLSPDENGASPYLRGFVFLETDRISSLDEAADGWTYALDELSFLTRIVLGEPVSGEGHQPADRALCLGIVPWAPVPAGPATLARYLSLAKQRARTEEVWKKVRGVRYLVQDKPAGTMLAPGFIEGLKWLGRQKLAFDLGIDARQSGLWQLREAVQTMQKVYDGVSEEQRTVFVINHLCKPNLRLPYSGSESTTSHADYIEWKALITAMAAHPTTYMKLSGGFSELPPLSSTTEPDIDTLVDRLQPWTDAVFHAFGPERVMFGSDWPVCNIGGGGNAVSWQRWSSVVERVMERRGLTKDQKAGVWGGVAVKAYGLEI